MCEHVRDFKTSSAIEIAPLSLFSETIARRELYVVE
jgi:hypothetical protein